MIDRRELFCSIASVGAGSLLAAKASAAEFNRLRVGVSRSLRVTLVISSRSHLGRFSAPPST